MRDERLQVLVVDDDESVRSGLRDILRTELDVSVQLADDGREALDSIARGDISPDVILLDLAMPRLDGPAFLQALDAIEGGEEIEVVVITGLSDEEIHVDVRARALRLLQKPFRLADIRAVIAYARRSLSVNV